MSETEPEYIDIEQEAEAEKRIGTISKKQFIYVFKRFASYFAMVALSFFLVNQFFIIAETNSVVRFLALLIARPFFWFVDMDGPDKVIYLRTYFAIFIFIPIWLVYRKYKPVVFGKYAKCSLCNYQVLIYDRWRCDKCNNIQKKEKFIYDYCGYCRKELDYVYCEHCHGKLILF